MSNIDCRLGIDPDLGQLTCAPESRLLYAKALLHALTSFPLSDGLTGRTGTEEALRTLESGRCQPWQPLSPGAVALLEQINYLVPDRKYYPLDKRDLQTVAWSSSLTASIQHESFSPVVRAILAKSDQLKAFEGRMHGNEEGAHSVLREEISHLCQRAETRRLGFERGATCRSGDVQSRQLNFRYTRRNPDATPNMATIVYQVTKDFVHRSRGIQFTRPTTAVLQGSKMVGGFHETGLGSAVLPLSSLICESLIGQFGTLASMFRRMESANPYQALFKLALLTFAPDSNIDLLRLFIAYFSLEELGTVEPPDGLAFFNFKANEKPSPAALKQSIHQAYNQSDISRTTRKERKTEVESIAMLLCKQWPTERPQATGLGEPRVLDRERVLNLVRGEWARLHRNWQLSEYLDRVHAILDKHRPPHTLLPQISALAARGPLIQPSPIAQRGGPAVPFLVRDIQLSDLPRSLSDGLAHGPWASSHTPRHTKDKPAGKLGTKAQEVTELAKILTLFTDSPHVLRQCYGKSLEASLEALENSTSGADTDKLQTTSKTIQGAISNAHAVMKQQLSVAFAAFSSRDPRFKWLELGGLWLWNTPVSFLELLRTSNTQHLAKGTRALLISFGLSITRLQRLRRILNAELGGDHSNAALEWRNTGHGVWNPTEHSDWLLLEIDNNMLIRPDQVEVARAIIAPAEGANSVLQMNMGSGKTSCIVPMTMSILADGMKLARLVVPKALLAQTAQIIQARLGGLVGRDITHVPFSRRTATGQRAPETVPLYIQLHEQVRTRRGIILTTPEHLLSFKLGGVQRLADGLIDEARAMMKYQARLSEMCRDVLDESDFILATRTQLIYPSGPLLPLDGHPYRWITIQALLSLVEDHLHDVQNALPKALETYDRSGGFPVVHFLHRDAEDEVNRRIIRDISDGKTTVLALVNKAEAFPTAAVQLAFSTDTIHPDHVEEVSRHFPNPKSAANNLLLAHGLLVRRILLLCLKKRWNVEYGFHPNRHPVAVPYEAKGVPSELSEFGHPDVALILTCLSFYYTGLTQAQFRQGLKHILSSDDPAMEYDRWTQGCNYLPEHLRHWNTVNLENQEQFDQLWAALRLNRGVLNHFMNTFVFPVHARQFDVKIQASGWDLPLVSLGSAASSQATLTTGFSGTNDNRMLLPLTIRQDDLDTLRQTNAEVLTYLLQPRNRQYYCASWRTEREGNLLGELSRMGIRLLIDAGAYVLEQDNLSLARLWLTKDYAAKAAVYFGADNRPWVYYRDNKQAPLIATPFADALDDCVVYLDEAHTRGVDLKFPRRARGALTLALGQTKDHTVQGEPPIACFHRSFENLSGGTTNTGEIAAMRLRQLGTTQSIVFFAPPEVHQSIVDVCNIAEHQSVDSSHVVAWLLEQTCRANEKLRGLYLAQGYDFCRRAQASQKDFLANARQRAAFLDVVRRPERLTLSQLYGANSNASQSSSSTKAPPPAGKLSEIMKELNRQSSQVRSSDAEASAVYSSALEEVEQEREVECQAENVQQKDRPPPYDALTFPGLHANICRYVKTGRLSGGSGYESAFGAICRTKTGRKYNTRDIPSKLFVSAEFMRTIQLRDRTEIDDFLVRLAQCPPQCVSASTSNRMSVPPQRPVEWILWNPSQGTALILVPEEAELVIPIIQVMVRDQGTRIAVHLVTYATPFTREMSHFNDLAFYTLPPLPAGHVVPEWLCVQLGIFAGKLYDGYEECMALKRWLDEGPEAPAFADDPSGFLLEWLALRRQGMDVSHTPVGYVCQGRTLGQDHHFFTERLPGEGFGVEIAMGVASGEEDSSEEEMGGESDYGEI